MDVLSGSVLAALAYTDQFQYPLTTREVWERLPISAQLYSSREPNKAISLKKFVSSLLYLKKLGKIDYSGGYWFISGSDKHIELRENRFAITKEKIDEIDGFIKLLDKIPMIRGVALTGSASMMNASENDDVDFLIITSPNRLWLTRPLVILLAWIRGKRRSWHQEEKNSWCFNLWLDTNHLQMPMAQRNVYTAYEACQTKWIISKSGTKKQFFKQNDWVGSMLPFWYSSGGLWNRGLREEVSIFAAIADLLSPILAAADYAAYVIQLQYMQPHRTVEKVSRGYAFFHPRDTFNQVMQEWRSSLKAE